LHSLDKLCRSGYIRRSVINARQYMAMYVGIEKESLGFVPFIEEIEHNCMGKTALTDCHMQIKISENKEEAYSCKSACGQYG